MEAELDDDGRVIITSERYGTVCDQHEEEIESEEHFVRLMCYVVDSDVIRFFCDISVGAIDEVVSILRDGADFPAGSCLSRRPVEETDGYVLECPVCGSGDYEGEVVALEDRPHDDDRAYVQDVHPICHPECEEELADIIERAWEYSDVLVSEQV